MGFKEMATPWSPVDVAEFLHHIYKHPYLATYSLSAPFKTDKDNIKWYYINSLIYYNRRILLDAEAEVDPFTIQDFCTLLKKFRKTTPLHIFPHHMVINWEADSKNRTLALIPDNFKL